MSYSPSTRNGQFKGSSRSTSTGYQNGFGSTIGAALPVSINTSGQMIPLDVSSEISVQAFLGLTTLATPDGANGQVSSSGRVENVTTSFSIGDPVYAGKGTALTNQKPDLGVAGFSVGDFVIFLGVVVKNEFNSSAKDIQLLVEVVGQL